MWCFMQRVLNHLSYREFKDIKLPQLIGLNDEKAIWSIEIPEQSPCYMSIHKSPYYWVVYVDATRFYKHWLLTKNGHCVKKELMPYDYKYKDAIRGFSHGKENPVPLADVSVYDNRIRFTNGVTRTFWLIVNECGCFPIKTDKHSYQALVDLAGIGIPAVRADLIYGESITP